MTQRKNYRMDQINRLLREEIAAILLTELQDMRLSELTVTEVRTSRDLYTAIVFITSHRGSDCAETLGTANRSAGLIRKLLYPRLHLRRIPELEFRYDDSLDAAERIFRTLHEIKIQSDDSPNEETEE